MGPDGRGQKHRCGYPVAVRPQMIPSMLDETRGAAVQTDSESLFTGYCDTNGIPCKRIRRSSDRTPDYCIQLQATDVVCEVKQLNMSAGERDAWMQALKDGSGVQVVKNRVRAKVTDALGQLRSAADAGTPTLVVVFDGTPFAAELDHESVVQALYGTIRNPIRISGDGEPTLGEPFFDSDGAFHSVENSPVSALAVLEDVGGSWCLRVYHNSRAAAPLDQRLFDGLPSEQVVLPGDTSIDV